MTRRDLSHAIARMTGDSLRTIQRLGFQLTRITPADPEIPLTVQDTESRQKELPDANKEC